MFPDTDFARGVLKVVGKVVLGAGSGDTGRSTSEVEYAEERVLRDIRISSIVSLV
jgi:hypothetical protein